MANRSDFYSAKLPRQFKRMFAIEQANGWIGRKEYHEIKNIFVKAHANHVAFKMKRHSTENRDASEAE